MSNQVSNRYLAAQGVSETPIRLAAPPSLGTARRNLFNGRNRRSQLVNFRRGLKPEPKPTYNKPSNMNWTTNEADQNYGVFSKERNLAPPPPQKGGKKKILSAG